MTRNYTQDGTQADLIQFATDYPGWHSFAQDRLTVEHVCASHNLGIIEVNEHSQFRLKSPEKARQFLAARS